MKHLFLLLIPIMFCMHLRPNAQKNPLDSLRQIHAAAINPKAKVDALNELALSMFGTHNDSIDHYVKKAWLTADKIGYHKGKGQADYTAGLTHRNIPDSAIAYYKLAMWEYGYEPLDAKTYTDVLKSITKAYVQLSKRDSALHYARQWIYQLQRGQWSMAEKNQDLVAAYDIVGNLFYNRSDYDSAAHYYQKAIPLADKQLLASTYAGLANIYSITGDKQAAIQYGLEAVSLAKSYSSKSDLVKATTNLGQYYKGGKNYEMAMKYADSSLALAKQFKLPKTEPGIYMLLGDVCNYQNKNQQALLYYQQAMAAAQATAASPVIKNTVRSKISDIYIFLDSLALSKESFLEGLKSAQVLTPSFESHTYKGLAYVYAKEKDYENAYRYYKKHVAINDSLFTDQRTKTINELKLKYETEKKEQQIQIFAKDKSLQDAEFERQQQELISSGLLSKQQTQQILNAKLIVDKQRQQMALQNQQLEIQHLDLENSEVLVRQKELAIINTNNKLEIEAQQRKLNQVIIGQQKNRFLLFVAALLVAAIIAILLFNRYKLKKRAENQQTLLNERLRISRELHDEVGATLSGIAMYSHLTRSQIQNKQDEEVDQSLDVIQRSSAEMVNKLSDIVWLLNPQNDSLQDVVQKLQDYALQMATAKNMQVKTDVQNEITSLQLGTEKRHHLYLICKEAINNAMKYSGASLLELTVTKNSQLLGITIHDNGQGFDLTTIKAGNGLGNMKDRAAELGCALEIKGGTKGGCTVSLTLKIT